MPNRSKSRATIIKSVNERRIWNRPIVTEVSPLPTFYPAEAYHDDYFARNPGQPYCQVIIEPKVAKLRKQHMDKLKALNLQAGTRCRRACRLRRVYFHSPWFWRSVV